jgi:hypothetical protein
VSLANRSEIIDRIEALSDDEIEKVGPYLHADLDAVRDLDALRAEIDRGRESARAEELLEDDVVVRSVLDRLPPQP